MEKAAVADGGVKGPQGWASNRIKHALYLPGWIFLGGDRSLLKRTGTPVLVLEYLPEMKGHIFCPECSCPLFRSPEDVDADKGGRNAYFAHKRGISTECGLRTKKSEGKQYSTEEEANQAVVDGELVIIGGFLQERPVSPEKNTEPYSQTAVEDQEGELASVPIARHVGKKFNLPSKITTVRGLCRGFDKNLYRYYYFPGAQHARLLLDSIRCVSDMDDVTGAPVLIFGEIERVRDAGSRPYNIRFVMLKFPERSGLKDFSIKLPISDAEDHGLNASAVGKVVIVYGVVRKNGLGLAVENPGWGELALLPVKYNHCLLG